MFSSSFCALFFRWDFGIYLGKKTPFLMPGWDLQRLVPSGYYYYYYANFIVFYCVWSSDFYLNSAPPVPLDTDHSVFWDRKSRVTQHLWAGPGICFNVSNYSVGEKCSAKQSTTAGTAEIIFFQVFVGYVAVSLVFFPKPEAHCGFGMLPPRGSAFNWKFALYYERNLPEKKTNVQFMLHH